MAKQTEEREPTPGNFVFCNECLDGKFFDGPSNRITAEADAWARVHNLKHRRSYWKN